jgi:hypothetical protein
MEANYDTDDSEHGTIADELTTETGTSSSSFSRRAALGLLGLGGLGVLGTQSAAAQRGDRQWRNDVDAQGNKLIDLGALAMTDNPTEITDFEGTNLAIDGAGVLNATDTRTNISDGGTEVVPQTTDINFGSNLSVVDDGDRSVTVNAAGSPWTDSDTDGLLETDSTGIDVDTVETDNLSVTNIGTSVELSSPQTLGAGAQLVVVEFDTEAFDDQNEFDTTNHQFVASNDGTYQVDVYLTIGAGGSESTLGLHVEQFFGSVPGPILAGTSTRAQSVTSLSVSRMLRLTAGDTLKVVASNINTTSDRTIFATYQSVLSIHRVG